MCRMNQAMFGAVLFSAWVGCAAVRGDTGSANSPPFAIDNLGTTGADCNTNGVLDECDLAEATSADCNTSGVPDECDIAGGTSLDANPPNGVPDECCIAPSVTVHPSSEITCSGASVTFNVAALGTPPLAYQWRKEGVSIVGVTEMELVIEQAEPNDSGTYDVEVSNECGESISDAATIIVWPSATGDINGDGFIDGRDIADFVEAFLDSPNGPAGLAFCAADMNRDGLVNYADVAGFVVSLGVGP